MPKKIKFKIIKNLKKITTRAKQEAISRVREGYL